MTWQKFDMFRLGDGHEEVVPLMVLDKILVRLGICEDAVYIDAPVLLLETETCSCGKIDNDEVMRLLCAVESWCRFKRWSFTRFWQLGPALRANFTNHADSGDAVFLCQTDGFSANIWLDSAARGCLASLLLVLRAKDAGVRFVVLKKSSAKWRRLTA